MKKRDARDGKATRIRWLVYPVAGTIAFVLVFMFLYLLYPVAPDTVVTRRMLAATNGRWNALYHADPIVAGAEPLARASPDVLYSFAPIVLGDNPVLLEVELGGDDASALHYWVLGVFTPELDNVFVTDDQDPPGKRRRKYVFVAPGVVRERADPEATLVELAQAQALLIMQYVPLSADDTDTVDAMRRQARLYELWMKL